MTQTPNFHLNQWSPEDYVRRTDFNADNAKIDAALGQFASLGNCEVTVGQYVGTGQSGAGHPNSITFPFKPMVVFIIRKDGGFSNSYTMMLRGQNSFCNFNAGSTDDNSACTWGDRTLSWYSRNNSNETQFNSSGSTYLYGALGVKE